MRTQLTPPAQGYAALADPALVALVADGDGSALETLYGRYGPASYALARRVVADDGLASDVVRAVFLAVWRDATGCDAARGGFAAWLLTATHRAAVDSVRREEHLRKRRTAADVLEFAEAGPAGDDEAPRRDRVRAALAGLPDAQRAALGLAYFGGYTQREIAQLTGAPLATVRTRLLAGMRRLRDVLAEPADGEPRRPA